MGYEIHKLCHRQVFYSSGAGDPHGTLLSNFPTFTDLAFRTFSYSFRIMAVVQEPTGPNPLFWNCLLSLFLCHWPFELPNAAATVSEKAFSTCCFSRES